MAVNQYYDKSKKKFSKNQHLNNRLLCRFQLTKEGALEAEIAHVYA
jgi:hypothetical protein